jgi:malate dehydrogenase
MVEAVATDSKAEMPVCAWVTGQYGISDVYLGVSAKLGRGGVEQIVELPLAADELAALKEAAEAVRAKQADVTQFIS